MAERMARHYPGKVVGSAPNSTDGTAIVAERVRCEREGLDEVRRGLGLSSRFYLAGLGRLVAEKDFARLLRVAAALRDEGLDVGVILIGDGPEEQALRRDALALGMHPDKDVVLTGPISDGTTLARWLFAADACVSPGFLGLSTVDCLFAGVPVISYAPSAGGPYHSPEWRYLASGSTGYFADTHTDEALAEVCRDYLARPSEQHDSVRAACAEYARKELSITRMADGMLEAISTIARRGSTRTISTS
jgi:glycosyltransferase involved in cell wall biosynthesis